MDEDIAIRVDQVSKSFILPHLKPNSVKSLFTGFYKSSSDSKNEVQQALQDISFDIKKGEFFGIVGRNGSGKSTLLKILAGIYQPSDGSVVTVGKLVPFIELGVGFNPELTGRENVYLNGAMLGFTQEQIDSMYDDIVEFAELRRFMDQKLKNYSSGMQVRLAFSMATRAEADILLVDEVLAVGDADFQRKCYEYFKGLKKRNVTVIFVSHDMNAVREYCDRAVMIEKSVLVASGDPERIATKYMRLFANQSEASKKGDSETRWGDKQAQFSSVSVTPGKIKENDDITITCEVTAHKAIESPIVGFAVRNGSGDFILGTNSQIKHQPIGQLAAGEKITIAWTIPNIFTDGVYTVNLAAVHDNGVSEFDHWDDAATFKIYKEERTPYVVTPQIGLKIVRG